MAAVSSMTVGSQRAKTVRPPFRLWSRRDRLRKCGTAYGSRSYATVVGEAAKTVSADACTTGLFVVGGTVPIGAAHARLRFRLRDCLLRNRGDSSCGRAARRRRWHYTASILRRGAAACSLRHRVETVPFREQGLIRASLELTLPRGSAPGTPDARCARRDTMP